MIIQISVKIQTAYKRTRAREGQTTGKGETESQGKRERVREGGNRAEEYGTDIKESRIIQPQDE